MGLMLSAATATVAFLSASEHLRPCSLGAASAVLPLQGCELPLLALRCPADVRCCVSISHLEEDFQRIELRLPGSGSDLHLRPVHASIVLASS